MTIFTQDNASCITYHKAADQLDRFCRLCLKQDSEECLDLFDRDKRQFFEDYSKTKVAIKEYQVRVRSYSILAVLHRWLEGVLRDPSRGNYYIEGMQRLVNEGLFVLSEEGKPRLIENFRSQEHMEILENIRCLKELSFFEKDRLVHCYIQFSRAFSEYTFHLIPPAYDPDRERVVGRVLDYDLFMEFIQYLSQRDVLIAKLLYFGAQSIEDVLDLQLQDVDFKNGLISFRSAPIRFPKHLMQDLYEYVFSQKEKQAFVFVNFKGERVNRTHLVNAFARVSSKHPGKIKITPSILFKSKNEG